ncbi:Acyl-CoA hydrolase protein [Dioscorea alata]|uniref:Acyl-CoA hydrolase protein n=1 Tax=Dioscorea alata TaxID=55571 RepID=A0ACB7W4Y7_DIOAL|nr:Acyl-CoA hydrolase protein [Dioscorea alata]
MGRGGGEERAMTAREWLERMMARVDGASTTAAEFAGSKAGNFDAIAMWGLKVLHVGGGRALCSLCVPKFLTDEDGCWHAGSIATVIDDVGAAAILTTEGHIKVSVDFEISYFSPAKVNEEVEIDAKVVGHKGQLSVVLVEIRKQISGELVALGRQWMSTPRMIIKGNL